MCHALHRLLQLRVVGGALQATFWCLQAQPIEVIQRANGVHPGKCPRRQIRVGVGQLQQVCAYMGPAKCQHHPGMQPGKLLVRRVAVAADDAVLHTGQLGVDHRGGARRVEHIVHHRVRVKHPQIPTVAHLTRHIDEHRPARLIGVPVRGTAQLLHKRLLQGREQRRQRLQAAGQRARRHVQPVIGQILQQPMAGAPVEKLVQQHAGPYR